MEIQRARYVHYQLCNVFTQEPVEDLSYPVNRADSGTVQIHATACTMSGTSEDAASLTSECLESVNTGNWGRST